MNFMCFGEVLWDVFPEYQNIGGAPLNMASRLSSFNNQVYMVSRVGRDKKGEELLHYMDHMGVNTAFVSSDEVYKTGEVLVNLDNLGVATYTILNPVAWDFIPDSPKLKFVASKVDAFFYGSLAARSPVSRTTLFNLLELKCFKVFDVNLRFPHYSKTVLLELIEKADFIKMNDEELYFIADMLGSKYNSIEQNITFISRVTKTEHVCVTKGRYGAVLWYNQKFYYNSGYRIKVKDTVGSGDSFLASLITKLLSGEAPQSAINFACAVGALVAQEKGANPELSMESIKQFIYPE
ncbi:carbohydrate kinase family protein [Formosa sp. S-31]|uniref:carbohydrate kinase family protein n=1 Tax=Formosa sp. S-31 TaxID=2790949 RepID=UPI003EBB4C9A